MILTCPVCLKPINRAREARGGPWTGWYTMTKCGLWNLVEAKILGALRGRTSWAVLWVFLVLSITRNTNKCSIIRNNKGRLIPLPAAKAHTSASHHSSRGQGQVSSELISSSLRTLKGLNQATEEHTPSLPRRPEPWGESPPLHCFSGPTPEVGTEDKHGSEGFWELGLWLSPRSACQDVHIPGFHPQHHIIHNGACLSC